MSRRDEFFGFSVDISGDTIVATKRYTRIENDNHIYNGVGYVYVKPTGGWESTSSFAAMLSDPSPLASEFGWSIAIDIDTVVIGAPESSNSQGAAHIFVKPPGGWGTNSAYAAKLTAQGGVFYYESGDCFFPEMLVSAHAMQAGLTMLKSHLKNTEKSIACKVVIGVVKDDLLVIGKNLVAMMLKVTGFEVIDLGTDVSQENLSTNHTNMMRTF